MDEIQITDQLRVPASQFRFEFSRSSGPGGQNVNKVNSKVLLRWRPAESGLPEDLIQRLRAANARRLNSEDEFLIVSQRFRDQLKNRGDCVEKLRVLLVEAANPPKARKRTRPPRRMKEARLRDKQARSEVKSRRRRPTDD